MCGLIAWIEGQRPVDQALFARLRDTLSHRGPDAAGLWVHESGRVALGHRRLTIIDTSQAANQPMAGADHRLQIVFNGEIYNYIELRRELQSLGSVFRTQGDTEVLLEAYRVWGEDCLLKLNGMFAFVIWDGRDDSVLVARDRYGEKPLFFAPLPDGGIGIASEMKALVGDPRVGSAVDESTLGKYVGGAYYEEGEDTLFARVRRLPPAHAMRLDRVGRIVRKWRYFVPAYEPVRKISPREAVERFRELMIRSVELRLRSDVPVGSSLSGGLDSSMIVGILADLRRKGAVVTQKTFSARFAEDPTMDEGPYIDSAVRHTGAQPYGVNPDPLRLMEESQRLHWHQEEPFLSASIYLQWCVARLAREQDTVVLIDGQGADELLGGYQFYFKHRQLDQLDEGRVGRAMLESFLFSRRLRRAANGYSNSKRRFNHEIAYGIKELAALRASRPAPIPAAELPGIPPNRPGGRLRRVMGEAMTYNSLPQLLRYADRNAMAFSREGRLPFLDNELVAFCNQLPDDVFARDGWQKYVLRKAAAGFVPDDIRWRADKVGYAAPLDIWLRGSMKDWAYERLFRGRVRDVPGFDPEAVERLWADHQSGAANTSWALWRWISLDEWMSVRWTEAAAPNRAEPSWTGDQASRMAG